jgi:4-hydroxybenzoate polyprenyltransferase
LFGSSGAKICWRIAETFYWCFLEARPAVVGIFLLRFLAGASFTRPLFTKGVNLHLWEGAALWICVTLSVYILNGVMDVEEDRTNGSTRPVASGKLTTARAAGVAVGLGILSLVGGLLLGRLMACSVVVTLVLGWLYSGPPFYLKRHPAAWAVIGIAAALITYNAGYASNVGDTNGGGDLHSFSMFASVMALWLGVVSQTKDLSDIEGDEHAGRRSVPVVFGDGMARLVFSGTALCLGCAYVLVAALLAPGLLLPALVLATGAVAVAVTALSPWSKGDRLKRRRPYKAFMLTQYGVNLAVVLWVVIGAGIF